MTWEGDVQNDVLNVWRRTATYSNPCPASVFTAKTEDITYILNSGSQIADLNHFTTDPAYCKYWMTDVTHTNIPAVFTNRIDNIPYQLYNVIFSGTGRTSDVGTHVVGMNAHIAGTNIPYNVNVVIVNDCPTGPTLSSITKPSAEDNPTVTYYIGRYTDFHLPQWTTSPDTCALKYNMAGPSDFNYVSDVDEKSFTVSPTRNYWNTA